jgi:tetratricopeptide (TPR) repeat protein
VSPTTTSIKSARGLAHSKPGRTEQRWGGARRGSIFVVLFALLSVLGVLPSVLPGPGSDFDQANRLYEQGKYADAIAGYKKLLEAKHVSAAIYFNLGNAYFKSGEPGQAIVSYRLAQQLSPRDPDIRANLQFARDSIGSHASDTGTWQRFTSVLTLNELTLTTFVLLWISFLFLGLGLIRPAWKPDLRSFRNLAVFLFLVSGAWLGLVARTRLRGIPAVVIEHEASVRYGPFAESQTFYTLRDGSELKILNRKDDWLEVIDPDKRVGWVQSKEVLQLPRG